MADLSDGEIYEMQGSGSKPYQLRNIGGVYSCSCPAWRNQSLPIEQRTCKHLRKLRGDEAEQARLGLAASLPPPRKPAGVSDNAEGPGVLLAESWDNKMDLGGWWMSEKLDGVRAYWDGQQFLSRQGNLYVAPDWFVEGLPDVPLDGELWLDRKKFQTAVSIARRQDRSDDWRKLRYVIFDAPALQEDFETRMAYSQDLLVKHKPPFAVAHTQVMCKGLDHMREELDRIEKLGGEGLMLRQPKSRYVAGRSSTLLKVKRFLDAEARVIGHEAGAGKHVGRLGSLLVELPNGKRFSVGTGFTDKEREAPPPLGSTISFRYQELSDAGIPRFPSFLGVRQDVTLTTPTVIPASALLAVAAAAKAIAVSVPAAPPAATAGSGKARYFEFTDAKSSKFWEVSVSGCDMTTRWGKLGSAGQSKTKSFKDEATAQVQANKLIEEKTGDGYVEGGGTAS